MVLSLYRQFQGNPAWERVRSNAKDGDNFVHDVFTLAFVALMGEVDTGVNVQEVLKGRASDVLMAVSSTGFVSVEVKAPQKLQDPTFHLTPEIAYRLIRDSFRSADPSEDGQLPDNASGLLALGAWHLSDAQIAILDQAAQKWFEEHKDTKPHLFGLALLFIKRRGRHVLLRSPVLDALNFARPATMMLESKLYVHFSRNPYYSGTIQLQYV